MAQLSAAQKKAAEAALKAANEELKTLESQGYRNIASISGKFGLEFDGKAGVIELNSDKHVKVTPITSNKTGDKFTLVQYWVNIDGLRDWVTAPKQTEATLMVGQSVTLKVSEVSGQVRASIS